MGLEQGSEKYFKLVLYLVVIVLINVAGFTLFFRMDLTANKIYSLSKASKQVISSLSEPLTVKVFFSKNLPPPHNTTEVYLRDLLDEYSLYGNENFNYRFYDVSSEEGDTSKEVKENQKLAESYGVYPVRIQAIEKDEVKFQRAYMGVVIIHGDLIERIQALRSTDRLEYELTSAFQKLANKISVLLALPERIRIKLFLSPSLEAIAPYLGLPQLVEVPERLKRIVESLNDKSYGKLEFEYVDSPGDDSMDEVARRYNLLRLKWPAIPDVKVPAGEGVVGLVLEYKERAETIPLIRVQQNPRLGTMYSLVDLSRMEPILNDYVESLILINEDLGYLADHETLRPLVGVPPGGGKRQDVISNFPTFIRMNYNLKRVYLKRQAIPDSLNCLLVAGPKEPFTDYELLQIDQYLMRGNSLALFVDVLQKSGNSFVHLNTGLEKLLEHYGIRIKQSYVMDKNCVREEIPIEQGGGQKPLFSIPVIKNEFINKDLDFMRNTKRLLAIDVSPLELKTEQITKNGLQAHELFSSSEESWEWDDPDDARQLFPPKSEDEMKSLPMAYVIEGEFPSYFAGKPLPQKELAKASSEKATQEKAGGAGKEIDSAEADLNKKEVNLSRVEGEGGFIPKGRRGRIAIIASSGMLKDNIVDIWARNSNAIFIMNLLDYLNDREEVAVMRSKGEQFNPLPDTGARTKTAVKYFNIAGLPALVVLFGLAVWFNRRFRQKRIQSMFGK